MAILLRQFVLKSDSNAQALYSFLKANWRAAADAGRPLEVSVREYKAKRSTDQNKRYWMILNAISENAWIDGKRFSSDAWHEWAKQRFIGCEEMPGGGLIGISTTKLDTKEFSEYMDKIQAYATTELGIEII